MAHFNPVECCVLLANKVVQNTRSSISIGIPGIRWDIQYNNDRQD